jgi:hypothetical protein
MTRRAAARAYSECTTMTVRKADIRLNSTVTTFVSRESGAAELQVPPSTCDAMEDCGQLPKPYLLGPNKDIKRWRWREVEMGIVVGENIPEHQQDKEPFFRWLAEGKAKERKPDAAA